MSDQTNLRLINIEASLNSIAKTLDTILPLILSRLDKLESRMDGLESRMEGLESRMDVIESRMGSLEIKLDEVVLSTERQFDIQDGRIEALDQKFSLKFEDLESKMDSGFSMIRMSIDNIHMDYTLHREHELLNSRLKQVERKLGIAIA